MVIGGWRILSATIPRHRHAFPPSSSIRPSRFYPLADDDTHYTLYCARPIAYLPQTATTSFYSRPAHARIAVDRALAHPTSTLTRASHILPSVLPSFHFSFYAYALIPNSFSMAARRPSMPVSLVISGVRLAAATGASTTGRSATGQYIWAK